MPGLWAAVRSGIEQAHFDPSGVIELNVTPGMDIVAAIEIQLERGAMSASRVANLQLPAPLAVVLRAATPEGRDRCEQFLLEFIHACRQGQGNVYLLARAPADYPAQDGAGGNCQVFVFDGALSPDEMSAYVTTRMIGRPGPGSTRLFAALVREYAGFDARLAEQLIALSDPELLALPAPMVRLLDQEPTRWPIASWANGTECVIGEKCYLHPLHEVFVASHDGPRRTLMEKALERRGWRAGAAALLPWLEEVRQIVLEVLRPSLGAFFEEDPRRAQKLIGSGDRQKTVTRDVEELELGNIVGLYYHHRYRAPPDPVSQAAISVVHSAKPVRDALAHYRNPQPEQVAQLIVTADALRSMCLRVANEDQYPSGDTD